MRSLRSKAILLVVVAGMLFAVSGCGQPGSLIEGRYEIRGADGDVVRDTVTGLEWQRCSLGQSWDGRTCVGEAATYTFEEAEQAADDIAGWRLPTIEELRTLVYCSSGEPARFPDIISTSLDPVGSCRGDYQSPTIATEAFPNTLSEGFWSASRSPYFAGIASIVVFRDGVATSPLGRSYRGRVRFVRGGQ